MDMIIVILFVLLFLFSNFIYKDVFNPTKLFILFWCIQVIICILLFHATINWSYLGFIWIYILLSMCVFLLIKYKIKENKINKIVINKKYEIKEKRCRYLILTIILLGLLYVSSVIKKYGFSFRYLLSLDSILEMNNSDALQRCYGNSNNNIIDKILLIFVYLAPMCGGYFYNFSKNKSDKCLSILTFLPVFLVLFIDNAKAPVIGSIIFFASTYIISYILNNNGNVPKINKKSIIKFGTIIGMLYIIFFISMMFRNGNFDIKTYQIIKLKFNNYIFGHIPAFDYWFSKIYNKITYSFGKQTFIGMFDLLGKGERIQGIYVDSYNGGVIGSNVYTYFRGIIDDFGIFFSMFFLIIILIISTNSYFNLRRGNYKISNQVILLISYSFILYYIVSIFSYNSFTFAFILFYIFLLLIKKKVIKNE